MKNPWESINVPKNNLQAHLCREELHPLDLYFARDTSGNYLFILDAQHANVRDKEISVKLSGIEVEPYRNGDRGGLTLKLLDKNDWEIFYALCNDLIDATEKAVDEESGAKIILTRLHRWQEILRIKGSQLLKPEKIKGLLAELLFLKEQVAPEFGWDMAIKSWKGPEKAPQDFALNETAIEIKCQSGSTRATVKISSADQLEPQLPEGYLIVFTLADADENEGFDLNIITKQIRSLISDCNSETRERFEELLIEENYYFSDEYKNHRYTFVRAVSYKIEAGFPRIAKSDLHDGIDSVSYLISLNACEPFKNKPNWYTYE